MWSYGYAFVLIVNRDAKSVKEADQPQHLPWYGSWQTLEFCHRYGRFPAEAINLQARRIEGIKHALERGIRQRADQVERRRTKGTDGPEDVVGLGKLGRSCDETWTFSPRRLPPCISTSSMRLPW